MKIFHTKHQKQPENVALLGRLALQQPEGQDVGIHPVGASLLLSVPALESSQSRGDSTIQNQQQSDPGKAEEEINMI